MTKELSTEAALDHLEAHLLGERFNQAIENTAREILASLDKQDIVIYFDHCATIFAVMGAEGEAQVEELEQIESELVKLIDSRAEAQGKVTLQDVIPFAEKIYRLHMELRKSRTQ